MRPDCRFEIIDYFQEAVLEQPEYAETTSVSVVEAKKISTTHRTGLYR